jgi:predicted nuclease of predicted toxin-antitoxin system
VIIWLDAQLSPRLTRWIEETFGVECLHVRDLGLRDAEDPEIFQRARDSGAVVMTKDEDFIHLVGRNDPPSQVIWVTSGNMPNERFKLLLLKTLQDAISLIASGEAVVEIKRGTE